MEVAADVWQGRKLAMYWYSSKVWLLDERGKTPEQYTMWDIE
jgi:hypothetical protein